MKFTSVLFTLGLTAGVIAEPAVQSRATPVERDLSTITGVLSGISDKVSALDSAIEAYKGGSVDPVQSASDNLVDAINSGTTKVKATDDLSAGDALGLTGPVSDLKDKITTVIQHLTTKKSEIVEAKAGAQTYNDLQDQKAAAQKLSDAIVSKVPKGLDDIASGLASGISEAIGKGVDNFKDVAGSQASKRAEPESTSSASPASSSAVATSSSTPSSAAGSAVASSSPDTGAASVNRLSAPAGAVALAAMVMAF